MHKLEAGFHIPLEGNVLLEFIPEVESLGKSLAFIVMHTALEDCFDQGAEILGLPCNQHNPSLTSLSKDSGDALVRLPIFLLGSRLYSVDQSR
jgi:hypothetical protein